MFLTGSTSIISSVRCLSNLQRFRSLANLLFRELSFSVPKRIKNKYQNIWTEDFDSFLKMPKSREILSTDESSSEEEKPKKVKETSRKRKKEAKPEKKEKSSKKSGEEEEQSWDLGNQRFIKINDFKGVTYVNIREMYLDKATNELKPGFKGISLSKEQWRELVNNVEEIDKAVKAKS